MEVFKPGDQVTVRAIGADPVVLLLHPHVLVTRSNDRGYWVRLPGDGPGLTEMGPIHPDRLLPGWSDGGQWRC